MGGGWVVGGMCCGPMGLFDDTSSECIGELYLQLFPLSDVKHNTIILYWSSWACGPTPPHTTNTNQDPTTSRGRKR